jgi:hypothetical protein
VWSLGGLAMPREPQRLKPNLGWEICGTTEVVPSRSWIKIEALWNSVCDE